MGEYGNMAINFPSSIKEVATRMKNDVRNVLNTSNPFLKNSFIVAILNALAGRIFDFYYQLRYNLLLNLMPDTATGDYLERWGNYKGITRNSATQSNGYITATGTATTSIPSLTNLQTSDGIVLVTQAIETITLQSLSITSITQSGGIAIAITASNHNLASNIEVTISGANESEYNGTFTIIVTGLDTFTYSVDAGAATPATGTILAGFTTASIEVLSDDYGIDANIDAGAEVTFSTPIAGVDQSAYVQFGEISGGVDIESDADYKIRVDDAWRNPVALFNSASIISKTKEIAGVTRVWVDEITPAAGQVTIYFVRDNDVSIIPSAGEVATVKAKILTIKDATTDDNDVIVSAPTPVTVNFTFTAISPDTATMRTALENNLDQMFKERTNVSEDILEATYLGAIINTIDTETGDNLDSFTLTSPSGNISITTGEIGVLGTITF